MTVTKVIRRDGTITKFKIRKLVSAIEKNMQAVSIEDDELALEIAKKLLIV